MGNRLIRKTLAASITALFACGGAYANPENPTIIHGSPIISNEGNTLFIDKAAGAIINWRSFSIGRDELTEFSLGSPSAAVLNRVTGTGISEILGNLRSDGKVFLVNPNGILFGNGSVVNVGSLIASTLDISNENFIANQLIFEGNSYARTPEGLLGATSGIIQEPGSVILVHRKDGLVALVSNVVFQQGQITAQQQPEGQMLDDSVVSVATGTRVVLTNPKQPEVVFDLGTTAATPEELLSIDSAFLTGAIASNTVTAVSGNGMVLAPGAITANSIQTGDGGVVTLLAANNISTTRSEQGPNTLFTDNLSLLERHQRFIDASGNNGGQVRIHAGGTLDLSTEPGILSDDAVTAVVVSAQGTQVGGSGGQIHVSGRIVQFADLDARGDSASGLIRLDSSKVSGQALFETNSLLAEQIEVKGGGDGLLLLNNLALANSASIEFQGDTVFSGSLQVLDQATKNVLDRSLFEPGLFQTDTGAVGGIRVLNLNVRNGSLNFSENRSDRDLFPGLGTKLDQQVPSQFNAVVEGDIFSRNQTRELAPDVFQTVSTGEVDFENFDQIKLSTTAGNIDISLLDLQTLDSNNNLLIESAGSTKIGNLGMVSGSANNNLTIRSTGPVNIFSLGMTTEQGNNEVSFNGGSGFFLGNMLLSSFTGVGTNTLMLEGSDLNFLLDQQSLESKYNDLLFPRSHELYGSSSTISSDRRNLNLNFGSLRFFGDLTLSNVSLNLLNSSIDSYGSIDVKENATIRSTASAMLGLNISSSDATGSLVIGAKNARQLQELDELKRYEEEVFGSEPTPEFFSRTAELEALGNTSLMFANETSEIAINVNFESNTSLLIDGRRSNLLFDEAGEPLPGEPGTAILRAGFDLTANNSELYFVNSDPSFNFDLRNSSFTIGDGTLNFVNGLYDIATIGSFNRSPNGSGSVSFGPSASFLALTASIFPGVVASPQTDLPAGAVTLRNSAGSAYDLAAPGGIGSFNLFSAILEGGAYTSSNGLQTIGLNNSLVDGVQFGQNISVASLGGSSQITGNLNLEAGTSLRGSFSTVGDTFINSTNGATLENDESTLNTLSIAEGSTLTLGSGITVMASTNKTYIVDASQGTLINQGTLASNGSGALLTLRLNPNNPQSFQNADNAVVSLNQGTLSVEGGALNIGSGTLKGVGTVNANVQLDSAILAAGLSPGTLVINGDLDMTENSVTQVEILGPEQGTSGGYDFIQVNGTANLAGALNTSTVNYTPSTNQSFNFLKANSLNGTFGDFTDSGYTVSYTPTQANLIARAAPTPVDPPPTPVDPMPPVNEERFNQLTGTELVPAELVRSTVEQTTSQMLNQQLQSPGNTNIQEPEPNAGATEEEQNEDILLAQKEATTNLITAAKVRDNVFMFQNEYSQLQNSDGKTCVLQ